MDELAQFKAKTLGISIIYISQIENDKTKLSLEMLLKIAYLLETDPGYFLTGTAYHTKEHLQSNIALLLEGYPPEKRNLLIEIIKLLAKNN